MDIKSLLRSLLDHKVKFLVIGGWALPAYGLERMTKDIDIFFEPTSANAKRLVSALSASGYDGIEAVPLQTLLKRKVLMRGFVLQADTHPFVKGRDFKTAWKNRRQTVIKGLNVFVPSINDLIDMKTAAGRQQDRLDVRFLKKVRKKQQGNSWQH